LLQIVRLALSAGGPKSRPRGIVEPINLCAVVAHMSRSFLALAGAALLLASAPSPAHHSFAMFSRDQTVVLTGKVRDFQWANPHTWIQVVVTDANGAEKEWSIECGSPNMMARQGWKSRTLKPGDKVALVMHPMISGAPSGSLVSLTMADGRVLGPGGAPAPTTGNAPPPQ
jgi:hypothetical protein